MAGNVYAGFCGLAAYADQIATGWALALALTRSTVSGAALDSEDTTAVVGQLRSLISNIGMFGLMGDV